jgi:hypothetical protein
MEIVTSAAIRDMVEPHAAAAAGIGGAPHGHVAFLKNIAEYLSKRFAIHGGYGKFTRKKCNERF